MSLDWTSWCCAMMSGRALGSPQTDDPVTFGNYPECFTFFVGFWGLGFQLAPLPFLN